MQNKNYVMLSGTMGDNTGDQGPDKEFFDLTLKARPIKGKMNKLHRYKTENGWMLVAHSCNPGYSRG
jgi:hypothetical protein